MTHLGSFFAEKQFGARYWEQVSYISTQCVYKASTEQAPTLIALQYDGIKFVPYIILHKLISTGEVPENLHSSNDTWQTPSWDPVQFSTAVILQF